MKSFGIFSVMRGCGRIDLGDSESITMDLHGVGFRKLGIQDFGKLWEGMWGKSKGPANTPHRRREDFHIESISKMGLGGNDGAPVAA